MKARDELEAIFLAHLTVIEKILAGLARRRCLTREDTEEFGGWVKLRLIEHDYAIIAKWRGESTLPTYLTVVIAQLLREHRVAEWGRWRPSAAARQLGALAMRLEQLVRRDGMTLAQAMEVLRSAGETNLTDREFADILAQLPNRSPLRPVQSGVEADAVANTSADDRVENAEANAAHERARRALARALESLPSDVRLIVRMHFEQGMSIADIARTLALPQKPMYRQLERALVQLRSKLEEQGVSAGIIQMLLEDPP